MEIESVIIVFLSLIATLGLTLAYKCPTEYINSTLNGRRGEFKSPNFPKPYPAETECLYVLQGDLNDRIKVSWTAFDLKPAGNNASGCRMDYVDIYVVDLKTEEKRFQQRMCGSTLPEEYISVHQQLEIVFGVRSRQQGNHTGFRGVFEFVGEQWQPYPKSSPKCGPTFIEGPGGELTSPNYPDPHPPNIECTWMIRVRDGERILLNVLDLNLGQHVNCKTTYLSIWNGFASPLVDADKTVCGQMHFYEHQIEFKSTHFRVVIRFVSHDAYKDNSKGFRMAWTAFTEPQEYYDSNGILTAIPCPSGTCEGGEYCLDDAELLCNPLEKYCIDESLICDGVVHCGTFDHSDEEGCVLRIVLIVLGVLLPVTLLAAIPVLVIRLKRRMRMRRAQAKLNEEYVMDSKCRVEYDNCKNTNQDKMKYIRGSCTSPVRRLSTPGYIAVFSPSKQGFSVYDEYESDTCLDKCESQDGTTSQCSYTSPVRTSLLPPLPPVRTCTMTQSPPIVQGRKALCGAGGGIPPTPPESDHEFDLYSTVPHARSANSKIKGGVPCAKNNLYTTAPRANPRSVSATV